MTENNRTSHTDSQAGTHAEPQVEPTLRGLLEQPKGVLQKNLKTFVYLGAALLVIVAALFSSTGKKTPAQQATAKGQPPQPTLQDNTDKRAWSRAFYRHATDPGIVALCRLPITNRTLMLSPISTYDNRSARPSDSDSHGWLRLDHPGNAGHPLIRLQPVCMLICIGHNDHFVGASITCQLL